MLAVSAALRRGASATASSVSASVSASAAVRQYGRSQSVAAVVVSSAHPPLSSSSSSSSSSLSSLSPLSLLSGAKRRERAWAFSPLSLSSSSSLFCSSASTLSPGLGGGGEEEGGGVGGGGVGGFLSVKSGDDHDKGIKGEDGGSGTNVAADEGAGDGSTTDTADKEKDGDKEKDDDAPTSLSSPESSTSSSSPLSSKDADATKQEEGGDDKNEKETKHEQDKQEAEEEEEEKKNEMIQKKKKKADDLDRQLRPSEVVSELNRHIVGQHDAKRAVAIAMRNRWRRRQLPRDLMKEVTPRNVLMIGPTGCGKTEVARRMAALSGAPFIKVEATKFTEVGYHGRDVDQIIRDLMDISMVLTKKRQTEKLRVEAKILVEERILDLLTGPATSSSASRSRDTFRDMLRDGSLDEHTVEVDVPEGGGSGDKGGGMFTIGGDPSNPNVQALGEFMKSVAASGGAGGIGMMGGKRGVPTERKKMPISEARDVILELELERMLENVDLKKEAVLAVEESGIVFIDEIDKICTSRDYTSRSADASAEGVQRDLLPLVEGTTISTKYGNVNTDYILFIASGAFHAVKPSDMLPELQGRLPIRVELNGLTEEDLYRILTEPVANLLRQQTELLNTEGVNLKFEEDAIREIARMAALLNRTVENIGARRLHTVIERIMEHLSFEAAEMDEGTDLVVDKKLVKERLSEVMISSDLSRYIL